MKSLCLNCVYGPNTDDLCEIEDMLDEEFDLCGGFSELSNEN